MLTLTVYCNCIETGKLLQPPKPDWKIETHEDGMVEAECPKKEDISLLHEWWDTACPHPEREAFSEPDFATIMGAVAMRNEISQLGTYPVLVGKVFHDGTTDHYLVPKEVQALKEEIAQLDYGRLTSGAKRTLDKLKQAIAVSQEMQKPISF